jgi:SAM-dependent methyltransferase
MRATWAERSVSAAVYDFGVEREWLARPAGRLLWGTDVGLLYDAVESLRSLPAGTSVLDVPCGGGLALRGLGPGLRYVAADISPSMLDRTRRRAAFPVETVEADIERLPFADNEFDVCVTFNGLHCLPDPAAALRELARCVKPGGRLLGDTIVRGAGRRHDLTIDALRRVGLFGPGGKAPDLTRWLTEAGFHPDRLTHSGAVVHFAATRAG